MCASHAMFVPGDRSRAAGAGVRSTSANRVLQVSFSEDALVVRLADGCILSVPLSAYPRLLHATPSERRNWKLACGACGVHWPELGQVFSVADVLGSSPRLVSPTGKAAGQS